MQDVVMQDVVMQDVVMQDVVDGGVDFLLCCYYSNQHVSLLG